MSDYLSPEEARRLAAAMQKTLRDPGVQRALGNAAETLALAQTVAPILATGLGEYQRAMRQNAALLSKSVEAVAAAREGLNSTLRQHPELLRVAASMARIQAQLNESHQAAGRSPDAEVDGDVDPEVLREDLTATLVADEEFREAALEAIADAPEKLAEAVPPDELTDIYGPEIDLRYVYPVLALGLAIQSFLQLQQHPAVKALVEDAEWVMNFAGGIYFLLLRYVDPRLRKDDDSTDEG